MPNNKSEKIKNKQNQASIKEAFVTSKAEKTAERPASLNGIEKL